MSIARGPEDAPIIEALEHLNLPVTRDTIDQMDVMASALRIYAEREQEHGATWKEFDARDKLHHCKHKLARMTHGINAGVNAATTDSALDLINYAVFFVRQLEGSDE